MAAGTADLVRVRSEFLEAIVSGDGRMAELVALEAVAQGVDLSTLYVDVMAPCLHDVGLRWQRGEMTIADEHLATALVDGVMAMVRRSATRVPRRSRERVLLAGVEAEGHVVGLRMIADLAEGAGFDVRYLGAAVPVDALEAVVRKHAPRVVGLSCSVATPGWAMAAAVDLLAERFPGVALLVGGTGVPPIVSDDPRVEHALTARDALDAIERIVARGRAAKDS